MILDRATPLLLACLACSSVVAQTEAPIAEVLAELDEDVVLYNEHITTLANPFFEGRAPGTEGNLRAADYIAFEFEQLGIEPAFTDDAGKASYFQNLEWGQTTELGGASVELDGLALTSDQDFTVLGYSGSGEASGEAVFVGYAIVSGPDGYLNFTQRRDLEGKIAIAMRFEPMDEDGRSKWGDNGEWSFNAALQQKVMAAARRGASAVVLVNPPGAGDARATSLLETDATRGEAYDVPVVMVDAEAIDRFIRMADGQGRSLMDLRRMADAEPVVLDLPGAELSVKVEMKHEPVVTPNVGGLIPGRGDLADEIVVIGAHYDHVGYGYFGSRGGAEAAGKIHPGADDNASGTSGMLLAAKHMKEFYESLDADEPARSTLLLGFTAEESGLVGSRHYVEHPIRPISKHAFMLNMDMIGRLTDEKIQVGGMNTAEGLKEWLEPFLNNSLFEIEPMAASLFGRSDHASFYRAGVPAVFVFTGFHDDYHSPTDTADKINRDGAVRVVEMITDIAMSAVIREDPFVLQDVSMGGRSDNLPQGQPRGVRVRFGVAPEYGGTDGVVLSQVFDGGSAANAGLRAGDRMTKWGRNELTSVESWMPFLSAAKPGDEVEITYVRGGEEATTTAVLQAASRPGD